MSEKRIPRLIFAGDTSRSSYEAMATLRTLKECQGKALSFEDFQEAVDPASFLEEGECLSDLLAEDPDTQFYSLFYESGCVLGYSSSGLDCFFTVDGQMPDLSRDLDSPLNRQIRYSQLAWVLAPCGSVLASGPMGNETERFRTSKLACFDGDKGSTRLQLLIKDQPVCGIQIKDNVIETLYTDSGYLRQGLATRLFDYAHQMIPDIKISDSRTDKGKAFVERYKERRKSHAVDNAPIP